MASQPNKRPPRQPLTPEEVKDLIQLRKLKQFYFTDKFKKTKYYKYLNLFNIICIVLYTEIIFAFMSSVNYTVHYNKMVKPYFGDQIIGGKRTVNSMEFTIISGKTYEVAVSDTCSIPPLYSKLYVGKDWILQKEIKVMTDYSAKEFFIRRASPLLLISILLCVVTFVLFGYNLNQHPYSLKAISIINSLSILFFLLV